MKNIVLTGGTGFIGSRLVSECVKQGYFVFILTRQKIQKKQKNVTFIQYDLKRPKTFLRLQKTLPSSFIFVDIAAAIPSLKTISFSLQDFLNINFFSHAQLVEKLRFQIEKIVYLSTIDVYGRMLSSSLTERQQKFPQNSYAFSKSVLEDYYFYLESQFFIPVTILRLSQVYGDGAHPINALPKFIDQVKQGQSVTLFGNGEETRTYIHIDDVVQALLLSIRLAKKGIYNLAGSETKTLRDLIFLIEKYSPKKVSLCFEKRKNLILNQKVNILKIKKEFRFVPKVKLEEGIRNLFPLC